MSFPAFINFKKFPGMPDKTILWVAVDEIATICEFPESCLISLKNPMDDEGRMRELHVKESYKSIQKRIRAAIIESKIEDAELL